MRKYLSIFVALIFIGWLIYLELTPEEVIDVDLWTYKLSADQESYLISGYTGNTISATVKETYLDKPILGFEDDFILPRVVTSLVLSKNLEQFNLNQDVPLYLNELVIPEDSKLKSISEKVRFDQSNIKTIYIPKNTQISIDSFIGNTSIEMFVVHPDNIHYQSVNGVLFNKDLTKLIIFPPQHPHTHYSIPTSVTTISEFAFARQSRLNTLYIPETVTSIERYAFYKSQLQEVTFSPFTTITDLGYGAFSVTTNLKHFDVPDSVTSLEATFESSSIESVYFSDQSELTHLKNGVFSNSHSIKELVLPKKLFSIHIGTFLVSGIESLTFQSDIIEFDPDLFSIMGKLKTVTFLAEQSHLSFSQGTLTINDGKEIILFIPSEYDEGILYIDEHIERIHPYAIDRFGKLDRIEVDENNLNMRSVDGVLYSYDLSKLILYPQTNPRESYQILDGTKEIVLIFRYTKNLKEIFIPESMETLPNYAFHGTSIESVTFLGESVLESIPNHAFYFSKIKEIVIPKSVIHIGQYAFYKNPLEKVVFEEGSSLRMIESGAFGNTTLESFLLPPNDIIIRESAFSTSVLRYVYIPLEVIHINQDAFYSSVDTIFFLENSTIPNTMNLPQESVIILFNQTKEDFWSEIEKNN